MAVNDKTVFDSGTTVPKSSKTVLESGAALLDGGTTLQEVTFFDSEGRSEITVKENAAIQKGDTILDTYRVETDAIEGGMGSVWRVHHTGWNVDLAMKQPQPKCFSTEKSKADFIHECEAWINLGLHPNIVSCCYVREIGGTPTIFSEWMAGGNLESAIESSALYGGTEDERQEHLLDIAIQFARGLHYAHEAGLIHQDVKPDNVLLTKEGEAKVADFGLAKARAVLTMLEGSPAMNEAVEGGKTMLSPSGGYTPAYCSMEQMDGRVLTRRTDIYSWAVSVMEVYVGSRPWANGVVAGLNCRSYFENTRIPIPEALKVLLAQCLESEQENRPRDFSEIEAQLHAIYEAETGGGYPRPIPKAAADTADSLNNRALSFLDLGKPNEAEQLWEKACLVSNSAHSDSVYNQSLYLWRQGKMDDGTAINRLRAIGAHGLAEALARECLQLKKLFSPKFASKSRDVKYMSVYKRSGRDFALFGDNRSSFYNYDLERGDCTFAVHAEKKRYLRALCVDEGRDCFYAATNGVYCCSLADGALIHSYGTDFTDVPKLLVEKERGLIFCIGGLGSYYECRLWEMGDGAPRFAKRITDAFDIVSLCFSPDGKHILLCGSDQTRVLSSATGEMIQTIPRDEQARRIPSAKPEDPVLPERPLSIKCAYLNTRVMQIIDARTGRSMKTFDGRPSFTYVSEDGKYAAAGNLGRMLNVYRIHASTAAPWSLSKVHAQAVVKKAEDAFTSAIEGGKRAMLRLDIGNALAALEAARALPARASDQACIELNAAVGAYCKKTGLHGLYPRNTFKTDSRWNEWLCFSSGHAQLLSYGSEKNLKLWSADGQLLKEFENKLTFGGWKALSDDLRQAVLLHGYLVDCDELESLLNERTGYATFRIERLFDCGTHAITKMNDSRGRGDYSMANLVTNEMEFDFALSHTGIRNKFIAVPERKKAFIEHVSQYKTKTGEWVVTQRGFELFDLATGKHMGEIELPPLADFFIFGSATERCRGRFLFWRMGNAIHAYDVDTAKRSELQNKGKKAWRTNGILPTRDGRYLFVGEETGAVSVWNTQEAREIYRIQGHASAVKCMDLSEDDTHLLTGDANGGITIWALDWEHAFPGFVDWDEGARPYLEDFLRLHESPKNADFEKLIKDLQICGYGWLRPEGMRKKLMEATRGKAIE